MAGAARKVTFLRVPVAAAGASVVLPVAVGEGGGGSGGGRSAAGLGRFPGTEGDTVMSEMTTMSSPRLAAATLRSRRLHFWRLLLIAIWSIPLVWAHCWKRKGVSTSPSLVRMRSSSNSSSGPISKSMLAVGCSMPSRTFLRGTLILGGGFGSCLSCPDGFRWAMSLGAGKVNWGVRVGIRGF